MSADVLIVGAGPTGLALGCSLLKQGINIRLIDKSSGPSVHSKAMGIHARTLEILEKIGVVDTFLERGRKVNRINFYHGKKRSELLYEPLDSPFPFILILPQAQTEQVLLEHLQKLGGSVEWNTELIGLEGGVAQITAGGQTESFGAPWIVGCDGAKSCVRHQVGYPFEGAELPETFYIADLRATPAFPIDSPSSFLSPKGIGVIFPFPDPHLFRLILPMKSPSDEMETLLRERGMDKILHIEKEEWTSKFQVHRRLVKKMRKGSIFLVGDAAHIHSPFGGQGMNTCIQDAYNLAWKLALVIKGKSPESILDSYHDERHPVALAVLNSTTRATQMLAFFQKFSLSLYFFIFKTFITRKAIRKRLIYKMSELAVSYPRSPIVYQPPRDKHTKGPKAGERAPDVVFPDGTRLFTRLLTPKHVILLFEDHLDFRKAIEEKYGEMIETIILTDSASRQRYAAGPHTLYLIRPDGYVAYRSSVFVDAEVLAYLKKVYC